MAVIVTTPINGRTDLNELSFPAPKGELNRLPAAPPAPEQRILACATPLPTKNRPKSMYSSKCILATAR